MLENLVSHEFFWLFLGIASFITEIIASIGGAGGLIIMPFMIGSGMVPQIAVATAKFSSFGMWAIVLKRFNKAKLIAWRFVIPMSILGAIGGVLGAQLAIQTDPNVMIFSIGIIFVSLGFLSLFKPDFGIDERPTTKIKLAIGLCLYLITMTISGFFPGGISIVIIFKLVTFMGLNALQAHATDILPWIIQTITSVAVYMMNGMIDYSLALSLFVGMAAGGEIGSRIAVKKGAKLVKNLITALAIIIGIYWVIKYGTILFIK